jgi:dTDP-4-amino-4,6-dideoxygalactose transaminase
VDAVNSATSGFDLIFEALHPGVLAEAVFPVWTFSSPVMSAWHRGFLPVITDVSASSLNMQVEDAARAIGPGTKLLVPTHFAGNACDMQSLEKLADAEGLSLVDDAAHALPCTLEGRSVGTMGHASVFSFYATKTLTTGEGGAVVTGDADLVKKLRSLALHGLDRDAHDRYRAKNSWRYDVAGPGFKANMPDLLAAIGRAQLQRVYEMRYRRMTIARRYNASLAPTDLSVPYDSAGHTWHLYVGMLPKGMNRDRFIERMAEHGIGCSVHFIPLCCHSFWRDKLRLEPKNFPNAMSAFERVVSLPIYSAMTDDEVDRVIETVRKVLRVC